MTIKIDLRDLTDARVARVKKNMGGCEYTDPCIIGCLMSPDARRGLDIHGSTKISGLISDDIVEMPQGQKVLAGALQRAFDGRDWSLVKQTLSQIKGRKKTLK